MIRRISKGFDSKYNQRMKRWEHGEIFSLRAGDKAMDYTVWWDSHGRSMAEDETHRFYMEYFERQIRHLPITGYITERIHNKRLTDLEDSLNEGV